MKKKGKIKEKGLKERDLGFSKEEIKEKEKEKEKERKERKEAESSLRGT